MILFDGVCPFQLNEAINLVDLFADSGDLALNTNDPVINLLKGKWLCLIDIANLCVNLLYFYVYVLIMLLFFVCKVFQFMSDFFNEAISSILGIL